MSLASRVWNDIKMNEDQIRSTFNIIKKASITTLDQKRIIKENLKDFITLSQILLTNKDIEGYKDFKGIDLLKDLLEEAESALRFLKKVNYEYYDHELVQLVEKLINKLSQYLEEVKGDEYYRAKKESKDEKEKLTKEYLMISELSSEIRNKDKKRTEKAIEELRMKSNLENLADNLISLYHLRREKIKLIAELLKR